MAGADGWGGGRCRRTSSSSSGGGNSAWCRERQSWAEARPSSLLPEVAFSLSFNVLFVCVCSWNPLSLLRLLLSPSSRSKSKMIRYKKNQTNHLGYICMHGCIFIGKYTRTDTCIYVKKGAKEKEKVVGRKRRLRKCRDEAPQYRLGSTLSFELLPAGF